MYSSVDGHVSDSFHATHLGQYALHQASLLITEATAVTPNGRITPHDLGIWSDEHVVGLKALVKHLRTLNSSTLVGMQLAHAGRKGSTDAPWVGEGHSAALAVDQKVPSTMKEGVMVSGYSVVGPSAVAYSSKLQTPKELSEQDIADLVKSFAEAARRADEAGFDVVEIHCAHGYLLHQFLSPLSNLRADKYGGSLENRMRFPAEVCRAVRKAFAAHKSVFIRISATDYMETHSELSWTIEDSIVLARLLWEEKLVDLVDVSAGGLHSLQTIPRGVPCYQAQYSEKIKHAVPGIVTGTVGLITTTEEVQDIITNKKADVVLMAREFLRSPRWIVQAAQELGEASIQVVSQYLRGEHRNIALFGK